MADQQTQTASSKVQILLCLSCKLSAHNLSFYPYYESMYEQHLLNTCLHSTSLNILKQGLDSKISWWEACLVMDIHGLCKLWFYKEDSCRNLSLPLFFSLAFIHLILLLYWLNHDSDIILKIQISWFEVLCKVDFQI